MKSFLYVCFTVLTSFVVLTTQHSENLNKKVGYFTSTYFYCDSEALDTSAIKSKIDYVAWLLPDNKILKANAAIEKISVSSDGYNITITDINDDVFGYYYCIVVLKRVTNNPAEIKSIRFGLNIDGADFSDLREQYKKGAIIGGIAAAIMAAVFGIGCLIWHFKYSGKHDETSSIEMKHESHIQAYDNAVFEVTVDEKEVATDKQLGPIDDTPNGESKIVESDNIHIEKL